MPLRIPGAGPSIVAVPVVGNTGPPGPPGGAGFEYVQSTAAATWIIDHNLTRKVHVSLFSDSAELVYADVVHGSVNQTTITFSTPTTGSAVIS